MTSTITLSLLGIIGIMIYLAIDIRDQIEERRKNVKKQGSNQVYRVFTVVISLMMLFLVATSGIDGILLGLLIWLVIAMNIAYAFYTIWDLTFGKLLKKEDWGNLDEAEG